MSSLDRVTDIARIIKAFIGRVGDSEKVRVMLSIKSIINLAGSDGRGASNNQLSASLGSGVANLPAQGKFIPASSNANTDPGNPFIFLLCALEDVNFAEVAFCNIRPIAIPSFDDDENSEIKPNPSTILHSQYSTLILSECLTIINSHRRLATTGQLFSNPQSTLEVSAALHLMAMLAHYSLIADVSKTALDMTADFAASTLDKNDGSSPPPPLPSPEARRPSSIGMIPEGVACDILDLDGKGYLRTILSVSYPSHLQKAYIRFVITALKVMGDDRHPLARAAHEAVGALIKRVCDDVLRTGISYTLGIYDI
ncbi:hypothetical protein HDU97_007968 [Phlyctochytrium planicorne]|nr:hypothetical protein HDU97_007968 [Phlyctochytrium planicorne]